MFSTSTEKSSSICKIKYSISSKSMNIVRMFKMNNENSTEHESVLVQINKGKPNEYEQGISCIQYM